MLYTNIIYEVSVTNLWEFDPRHSFVIDMMTLAVYVLHKP